MDSDALRMALRLGARAAGTTVRDGTYIFCMRCGTLTPNVWACWPCWNGHVHHMPERPRLERFTLTDAEARALGVES